MRSFLITCAVLSSASVVFGAGAIGGCSSTSCDDTNTCIGAIGDDAAADGAGDVTTGEGGGGEGGGGGDGGADGDAMSSGDSMADAHADAPDGDGFTCDPNATPKDNACIVGDVFGVFVSGSHGMDSNAGSKAAPLQTIQAGIAKAKATGKRLFVCAGTYGESLVIAAANDGVKIYGGLDCTTWTYAATNAVKVQPGAGLALKLDSLTTGVHIEDVEFDGANGASAGDSSIAVFANAAMNVSFKRVVITAGNGVAGAPGSPTTNYANAQADSGNSTMTSAGAAGKPCTCTNGDQSIGARGGQSDTTGGADGADGSPSLAENPTGFTPKHDGKRGNGAQGGNGCTNGDPGANPTTTAAGGGGATTLGVLSANGWTNATGIGSDGTIGVVAQGGGGGGGGLTLAIGGGGGGACGGCGGGKGTAGRAGGSSFALVSFNSVIALDTSTLTGGNAANGGKGGDGQNGQTGGLAGAGSIPGCNGGAGGNGTSGGGGGGGAGGISAGIFYKGTAPTMSNGTMATKGADAIGGGHGANGSPQATDGLTTASQNVMMAP